MKKIREKIEAKYSNALIDLENGHYSNREGLVGNIESYMDLLALIPKPRTEEEILKDFEALGYKIIIIGNELWVMKELSSISKKIIINKDFQSYECEIMNLKMNIATLGSITMQEHKLLNELFECWGWI